MSKSYQDYIDAADAQIDSLRQTGAYLDLEGQLDEDERELLERLAINLEEHAALASESRREMQKRITDAESLSEARRIELGALQANVDALLALLRRGTCARCSQVVRVLVNGERVCLLEEGSVKIHPDSCAEWPDAPEEEAQ